MLARRLASTLESLTIASHTLLRAASRKGRVCGMGGCTGRTCLKNAEGVCVCCSMRWMVCRVTANCTRCFIVAQRVFCQAVWSAARCVRCACLLIPISANVCVDRDLHAFGSYCIGHLPRESKLVENTTLDDRGLEGAFLISDHSTPTFWMWSFKFNKPM